MNDRSLMPPVSVTSQARNLAPPAAVVVVDPPEDTVVVVVELELLEPQAARAPAATKATAAAFRMGPRFRVRLIVAWPLCVADASRSDVTESRLGAPPRPAGRPPGVTVAVSQCAMQVRMRAQVPAGCHTVLISTNACMRRIVGSAAQSSSRTSTRFRLSAATRSSRADWPRRHRRGRSRSRPCGLRAQVQAPRCGPSAR